MEGGSLTQREVEDGLQVKKETEGKIVDGGESPNASKCEADLIICNIELIKCCLPYSFKGLEACFNELNKYLLRILLHIVVISVGVGAG